MQNISFTTIITFYLLIINIFTFFLYGIDKWKAQRARWRIPRRGMVGHARMAPQNPTCEVLLWCSDYSDSTGSFVGMDFFIEISKNIHFHILYYQKK